MFADLTVRSARLVVTGAAMVIAVPTLWTSGRIHGLSLSQDQLSFRKSALVHVTPDYPQDLAALGVQGVAVAEVRVNASGLVGRVEVLESPHPDVSRAMISARRQVRFPVVTIPGYRRAATVTGKMTYYFVTEDGITGVVRTPQQQADLRRTPGGSIERSTSR